MNPRFRLALVAGALALSGCGDALRTVPIAYSKNPKLFTDLKDDQGRPKVKLQARINQVLVDLFGPAPNRIKVPPGATLPHGGIHLAARGLGVLEGAPEGRLLRIRYTPAGAKDPVPQAGGYALYREHCLHCHGLSGDGNGPTAPFLWPRPRDYRRGLFKFTSTNGSKPTRDDLHRIIRDGIPNTSMPSFEALMTPEEIAQVIDYVIFLSVRGETELSLINEAAGADDSEADSVITMEVAQEYAKSLFDAWAATETEVLNPPIPRVASTRESIANGKRLFLGLTTEKLQCSGCHGNQARGDGPSFMNPDLFDQIVFGGDPDAMPRRVDEVLNAAAHGNAEQADALKKLWVDGSLDDWGQPLRPANINNGPNTVYKGGRRPIDIYWRIAKGINGAKMPAHASALKPEQIWDLVNFVLALPFEPDLLRDAPPAVPFTTPSPAVARR